MTYIQGVDLKVIMIAIEAIFELPCHQYFYTWNVLVDC